MAKIICTVTNDLSHDQRMIRICTSLQQAGHHVLLIGRYKPQTHEIRPQIFEQHLLACRFSKGKLFYIEYNLRLLFFLLRTPFDIVNAVDLDSIAPGYIASRLRNKTCVYDAHEYFTEVPEVIRRPRIRRLWSWVADSIIPRLEYCYTVGPALAHIMGERYGVSFRVIRNVPYRKPSPISASRTPKVILYQGMLNEGRGIETAIESMSQLPECQLWLAGDGDIKTELEEMVHHLQLNDKVRFLGFIPPHQLPNITQQAWLGINLLENKGLSYYYSLANKAFDYIQAGLPSIQMAFPEYTALQETHQTFILLQELSSTALAKEIRTLLNSPDQYEQLSSNCMTAATQLCWETEQQHLLDIYEEIC